MEKRYIIAAAVTFVILILWQIYFMPSRPPEPPVDDTQAPQFETTPDESPPTGERPPTVPSERDEVETDAAPLLPDLEIVEAATEEEIVVDTDIFEVVLTNRGGRVVSWTLKEYDSRDGDLLTIENPFNSDNGLLPLGLEVQDDGLSRQINEALHAFVRRSLDGGGEAVTFRYADGRGLQVEKTLEFWPGDYLVGLDLEVTDRGRPLPAAVTWGPGFETRQSAGGLRTYYYTGQVLWDVGGSVQREKKLKEPIGASGRLYWAGLEDQYFAALVVPREGEGQFRVRPAEVMRRVPLEEGGEIEPEIQPVVAVAVDEAGAFLYVGPKHYNQLRDLGHDLQNAVWFSSISLFALMARLLYQVLVWIHANIVANYGLAIILTTVALRIVLFPLNQFSMVRMRRMQTEMGRIQPKINAVKKKYAKRKDAEGRQAMNQELMALYKKEGVNPMGGMTGCLPLLAQFPILIGFYDMLLAAVELRGAPFFGWIQDLTLKDPYLVTPILMGATMFLQQKMSMSKVGDPMQQRIMMMTPVIFTVMFLNLPSGLVLYWFVNNLLGIGQQWIVNRHIGKTETTTEKAKAKAKA